MYFLLLFVLIIPLKIEKKYEIITYIKIFITSFIHFYFINKLGLLSVLSFLVIIYQIYNLISRRITKNDDNSIYNLAHEIKNPLAVCKGYLDMLDKDKLDKYLPIIKSEMNRSLDIMNDFLSLRKITLNKDLMDFNLLIEDVNNTLDLVLKENKVVLTTPKIDKELIIEGDYDKLKQVLINLIKNSYEADANKIKIDIKRNTNYLKINVIDNGKGISKYDLKRIGEIFYTTKLTGTGIGVSISKEIIKLHNGELSYDSDINKGTTATIILPLKYIF